MKNRFFFELNLIENQTVSISKEELRHFKVLHIRAGETVEIIDGKGNLAKAEFDRSKSLFIKSVEKVPPPKYKSILLQAITKEAQLDFLVEKTCELGVTDIVLFPATRSVKKTLSPNKIQRVQRLLVGAMKQCKRLHMPRFTLVDSFDQIKDLPTKLYLADPDGKRIHSTANEDCAVLVGPEAGFTDEEIETFTNDKKAEKISLSPNVLRCETASVISVFMLSQKC